MQVLVLGKNRFGVLRISHLDKDGFQSNLNSVLLVLVLALLKITFIYLLMGKRNSSPLAKYDTS